MSQPDEYMAAEKQPETTLPPPPGADVEGQAGLTPPFSNFRGLSNLQKWRMEDWMKRGELGVALRALALLFSFLSFILMATNVHGYYGGNFYDFEAFKKMSQEAKGIAAEIKSETSFPPLPLIRADVEGWVWSIPLHVPKSKRLSSLRKKDRIKKWIVCLRAFAFLLTLLSFILMATNIHGYSIVNFNNFEAFNYVLAIAVIAMVYTAVQTGIKVHQLCTGKQVFPPQIAIWVDFFGDQVMAYMLISSASAASPISNGLRAGGINSAFGSQSAAAISMSFLAFFSLASAALLSGYDLSTQLSTS